MNGIIYALYQFLPILISLIFLFMVKSLNLGDPKIQIAIPETEKLVESYISDDKEHNSKPRLEVKIREYLIIKGKLPKNKNIDLCDYAISNAGVASYTNIQHLSTSFKQHKPHTLAIVLSNPDLLSRQLIHTNTVSGIILAYSTEEKLEIVSQCT